jgi:hypothetical protein
LIKNELDALPPSTFIIDDFKKFFFNTPNKVEGMERFWKDFDP